MKCLEFLYFYLLPEGVQTNRVVSNASTSSSSSTESYLYPMSPFTPVIDSSDGRVTPTIVTSQFHDLDIPFVPQTPQHSARHSVGYPTPSHSRHISSSFSSNTPSLVAVPASPISASKSPVRKVRQLDDDRPSSRASDGAIRSERHKPQLEDRRWSAVDLTKLNNPGLGLGMTKSATAINLVSSRTGKAEQSKSSGSMQDPFASSPASKESRSSSGSSTVVPFDASVSTSTPDSRSTVSSGLNRSSTQLNFQPDLPANVTSRRPSIKRYPKSSTPAMSSNPSAESPRKHRESRPPGMRHSRTQSALSGLDRKDRLSMPPPAAPPPRLSAEERRPSLTLSVHVPEAPLAMRSSSSQSTHSAQKAQSPRSARSSITPDTSRVSEQGIPPDNGPRPTPARKAFPSGMTKGLPPSISTPNFASNLSAGSDHSTPAQKLSAGTNGPRQSGQSTPLGANLSTGTSSSTPYGANLSATSSASGTSVGSSTTRSRNTSVSSVEISPAMPLGALKRVPSAHWRPFRPDQGKSSDRAYGPGGEAGKIRSVEEKKTLVS